MTIIGHLANQLENIQILVIDECSLLVTRLIQKIDNRFQQITGSDKYFGNIMIILIGGFFYQYPPVRSGLPLYESNYFSKMEVVNLTNIYRQNDAIFLNILDYMRE